ncbi:hypothetical protein BD289DRAFT_471618 [Coniella lustricola]|uniref:Chitin synthesis regulation, congo red resistance, RCR protein n=1 Tax=Coniella lustricola TaxID=2025994 RepID=A0A2T3AIX4_9PEZI|nr:hypothetical protein BD289DRAFT_471618 [Coniella lustricola]
MYIPQSTSGSLIARYYDCAYYGNCTSSYNSWGRWVLAGLVILAALFLALLWSCVVNRRRRRRGLQPRYGTGWMMHGPGSGRSSAPQYNQGGWYGQNNTNNPNSKYSGAAPPPPQYTPSAVPAQTTGQTFNSNEGYYGQHNGDVPLQQPTGSYYPTAGGEPVYQAPSGPPPAKH